LATSFKTIKTFCLIVADDTLYFSCIKSKAGRRIWPPGLTEGRDNATRDVSTLRLVWVFKGLDGGPGRQIWPVGPADGPYTTILSGLSEIRGCAFDFGVLRISATFFGTIKTFCWIFSVWTLYFWFYE
jgi:hypothetical protein